MFEGQDCIMESVLGHDDCGQLILAQGGKGAPHIIFQNLHNWTTIEKDSIYGKYRK